MCSIVFTVSPCTLVGEGRRGRTTARGGLQSDDECKKSLSVCVCVALYSPCTLVGEGRRGRTTARGGHWTL